MSSKPYRLASGGRLIDRTRKLHFSFDGKPMTGFAGDTLASAVLASGQRVFGRSFKYHRPRGLVGIGAEEMNALAGVGDGARHEPNLRATQVEFHDGLVAVSQNRWPSLNFVIGALNDKFSRFFPGGFKSIPGSGWVFADTIANDRPHSIAEPFGLNRFAEGRLIDESVAAAVAH